VIQCARTKQQQQRRRKDSEDDSGETDNDLPEVDLYQLQVGTLRRYKRHYRLTTRPGLNKAQLADVSWSISIYYLSLHLTPSLSLSPFICQLFYIIYNIFSFS
jgi:hypothetical protein